MQAVEQQLLNFVTVTTETVVGDISNIYWVFSNEEPAPGTTGQRDILLIERTDNFEDGMIQGQGRFGWIYSGLDINLRSSYAADKRATKKDWMIRQADLVDGLRDALMGFFPVDSGNNAYTIEGFVIDQHAEPQAQREVATWGETIATYRFHYCPVVDTSKLTV